MEPIIAALARTQLKKIDFLIQQRKEINNNLTTLPNYHFRDSEGFVGKDAYTHVVLRFLNSDIFEFVEKCKKRGLLLRATWPTHQKLWENQDTENVRIIEKEFLTWDVNPMVTEQEIKRFLRIVSASNN
jgi:dTDP-4-amino-4,6-dideoxygalactose transaminase